MKKIIIFHPMDLSGLKVGGAETCIKGMIKYAPKDLLIHLVGASSSKEQKIFHNYNCVFEGKNILFTPVVYDLDENRKGIIPLILRYTFGLKKIIKQINSEDILFFNRIEPLILFRNKKHEQYGFTHNDINKQILSKNSEVFWSKIPSLYLWLEKLVFPFVNKLFCVDMKTFLFYEERYKFLTGRIKFIPTWVDEDIFAPISDKNKLKKYLCEMNNSLNYNKKWILFVGRLQYQKAPFRLIDSLKESLKRDKDIQLLVIGSGNLLEDTKVYAQKNGVYEHIVFLGPQSQQTIADFYRASDLLLLVSFFEGMPRCVVESLGCGLPVVSTQVGEVSRVVKNGYSGEIVEEYSALEIANKIFNILNNSSQYSSSNCFEAISEYTAKKVVYCLYKEMGLVLVKKR